MCDQSPRVDEPPLEYCKYVHPLPAIFLDAQQGIIREIEFQRGNGMRTTTSVILRSAATCKLSSPI